MAQALTLREFAALKILQWSGLMQKQQLNAVSTRGGWWRIHEPWAGAWQRNCEIRVDDVLTHPTVFSCVSLIAGDIAKMRLKLVEQDPLSGVWSETSSAAFSPIIRKPNHYQTRIKFFEQWIISKLVFGNTYVLKERDNRGVVIAGYILDPNRVKPLVAPNGEVFYELKRDDLSLQPQERVLAPASEVIHDVMVALYHPLVGVSPIYAAGIAAIQALKIQENSTEFFANGSNPGGVLTAPGAIGEETAKRLKEYWQTEFTGQNVGKVAVLGDGLKFERMAMTAVDAELIKQLQWSDEKICSVFHVPAYMVGVGPPPNYNNIEALNSQYYAQCLQNPIECIELLIDEGLGLAEKKFEGRMLGVEFDLDGLLRMDTRTLIEAEQKAQGIKSPNESRQRLGLKPVAGGTSPYLQQQNYSLEALAKRDAQQDPFAPKTPPAPPGGKPEAEPEPEAEEEASEEAAAAKLAAALMRRSASLATKYAA